MPHKLLCFYNTQTGVVYQIASHHNDTVPPGAELLEVTDEDTIMRLRTQAHHCSVISGQLVFDEEAIRQEEVARQPRKAAAAAPKSPYMTREEVLALIAEHLASEHGKKS